MFKGLGNIASIMRQAQEMGGRMQEIRERLKLQKVTGASGGGMVEVEVNGAGDMLKLVVEPSLLESGDREMIEDLVPAAVNQALAKARQLYAEEMKTLTEGINIPGVGDAISQLVGDTSGGN